MKKLVLLASFLGLFNLISAQVWETVYSPDVVSGKLLGVNANGNMYMTGLLDHTWDELVTSCNEEVYVVDEGGNVQIWAAEGLAWLISTVNGLNGQEPDDFAGRKVTIKNDLDMSGAIWTTLGQGTNYGTPNLY